MASDTARTIRIRHCTAILTAIVLLSAAFSLWAADETKAANATTLTKLMGQLDASGAAFRAALADVEVMRYRAAVKKTEIETGQVFLRRMKNHQAEIAWWIEKPLFEQAAVNYNKMTLYDRGAGKFTDRTLDVAKEDAQALINLGFGACGRDLLSAYEVTFGGFEKLDGINTVRLELVGKSKPLQSLFDKVELWIDPGRDLVLQQKRWEKSGDYQIAHYTNVSLFPVIHEDKPVTVDMVLAQMDQASARFRGAQADIELTQYTAVVREKDVQSGQIYFRRKGHQTDVALWITAPHPKQAVVKDDRVTFYDPRTKQLTERSLGNDKQDVEAVMNLGFGGSGHDLLAEYDVTLAGFEKIDGIETARMELVAKSEKLRRMFSKLVLWIDPRRDVALQQQRFESSGDYQLTHYTNINLSSNIPDDKFVIKK